MDSKKSQILCPPNFFFKKKKICITYLVNVMLLNYRIKRGIQIIEQIYDLKITKTKLSQLNISHCPCTPAMSDNVLKFQVATSLKVVACRNKDDQYYYRNHVVFTNLHNTVFHEHVKTKLI